MKVARLILAALVLAGSTAAGAVSAQSSLYYHYTYFSDAAKTTIVGEISERCVNGYIIVPYAPEVQFTDFYTRTAIGACPGLGDW